MQLLSEKEWCFPADELPGPATKNLTKSGPVPVLLKTILAQRGIASEEEINQFLYPSLGQLPTPSTLCGLNSAVDILVDTLARNDSVIVYGDYDADGITATALLGSFFKEIGLSASYYIPERLSEGYGLNHEALKSISERPEVRKSEVPVLVTVDCGITNHLEIEEAKKLGFKVIITDHHQPQSTLPEADAIINPWQPGCDFAAKELAGVGVAFYLAAGLRAGLMESGHWQKNQQPNMKKYLDLVAVGSVADMVPLTGANRIMVKAGLEVLNSEPRPGLEALLRKSGVSIGAVNSGSIAYQVAPRINAAGRVASPLLALQLLLSDDEKEAEAFAAELEKANDLRRSQTDKVFDECLVEVNRQLKSGKKALVLFSEDWHYGIIGLVASKIVNMLNRPVAIIALDKDEIARGSARSIDGLDILGCLEECEELLEKFGGHKAAAGLTLHKDNIIEFTERFTEAISKRLKESDLHPKLKIDIKTSIAEIMRSDFLAFFSLLEPFGKGNPQPLFCSEAFSLAISDARKIGTDSMRFRILANDIYYNGVGFGLSHLLPLLDEDKFLLAFQVNENEFKGKRAWELRVKDIRSNN